MEDRVIVSTFLLAVALVLGITSGAFGISESVGRVEFASPRAPNALTGLSSKAHYFAFAKAGVSAITSAESFNGFENWGIGIQNVNTSTVLNGAQVAIDSSSSGINMNGWPYSYYFQGNSGGFGDTQVQCPSPITSSETCPSSRAVIPAGSTLEVAGHEEVPATFTPGFDSSVTVGPVAANGDSTVTASLVLKDPRYQVSQVNQFLFTTFTDNADRNSAPAITMNGVAVPPCPQPLGTACADPVKWASYQYATAGGTSATCNSLHVSVFLVPYSGTPIPYQLSFQENEQGTGGCPIGIPHVSVAVATSTGQVTTPCTAGTDCSATVPITGLGEATAVVGPGQGVSAFSVSTGTIYDVNYPASYASPPPSALSTAAASSTTPGGSVTAINGGTTAQAENGTGVVLVSQFNSNPELSPPLGSNGNYFDVQVARGSTFTGVAIKDCNSNNNMNNIVDTLEWWNGLHWVPVTDANGTQVAYAGSPPCASVTLNSMTSPTIGQLTGTEFAVAAKVAGSAEKPAPVTVRFANTGSSLNGTAKQALTTLTRKLVAGATVTIVGYARGNVRLAKTRAEAVSGFLSIKLMLHVTLRTVTSMRASKATVTTIKQ